MKFNSRQLAYRKYRLSGMTCKASALKAGYSASTAISGKVEKVVDHATALEMAGFTARNIAETSFRRYSEDEGAIGHKYLETALKLMGARGYTQDKAQSAAQQVQVNIMIPESGIAPRQ